MITKKIIVKVKNVSLSFLYHFAENIDGERKFRLVSYRTGEKIKKLCRENIDSND